MKISVLIFICLAPSFLIGQNLSRVNEYLEVLTDSTFYGRGYVKDGSNKAADFLAAEFEIIGLNSPETGYFQEFSLEVNTYPSKLNLSIGGEELIAGYDFISDPNTGSSKGKWKLAYLDSSDFESSPSAISSSHIPIVDMDGIDSPEEMDSFYQFKIRALKDGPFIQIEDKLTWSVGKQRSEHSAVSVKRSSIDLNSSQVELNIKNKMMEQQVNNVIGFIPGRRHDSLIVFTAHYDHLGMMGPALFPGASDNASGTSMLLDIAHYYKENTPEYDTWFIAFAAEEAGLLGSKYFAENPLFDLSRMKVLINLDLMGSASKGIAIVNGKRFPDIVSQFTAINQEKDLVGRIKVRGQAANSDHYWFAEKGLPAIFIYTMGDITAYHDVYDTKDVIDWAKYSEVFTLITEFIATR